MKWLITLLFLLAVACATESKEIPPVKVARNFLEALSAENFRNATTWVTAESTEELLLYQHDLKHFPLKAPDAYRWAGIKEISKDTVLFQVALDNDGILSDTVIYRIVKPSGKWLVDYERIDAVGIGRQFLESFYDGNLAAAANYVTPASKRDLQLVGKLYSDWKGPEPVITGIQYDRSGDRAIVLYRDTGSTFDKKLNLMRYHGQWRVAFTKFPDWEPASL